MNYFGSRDLLAGLQPALAAAGAAQVVQIGSNSTTVTPNVPDAVIQAFLDDDEEAAVALIAETPRPYDSSVAYASAKTAITRWCRHRAVEPEWVGRGIRLNVIAPGAVQTPLLAQGQADETYGPMMEGLPIPAGLGQPDDIAAWIAFMLSPAAASPAARWCSSTAAATPSSGPTPGLARSRCERRVAASERGGEQLGVVIAVAEGVSSTHARFKNRWASTSHVYPMPPWTWTASLPDAEAAAVARTRATDTARAASPAAGSSRRTPAA